MVNGNIVAGLLILHKYLDDDDHSISAAHDHLYIDAPDPHDVGHEDLMNLMELGFIWSPEEDVWTCFL